MIAASVVGEPSVSAITAQFQMTNRKFDADEFSELPRLIILHRWESGLGFSTIGSFVSRITQGLMVDQS